LHGIWMERIRIKDQRIEQLEEQLYFNKCRIKDLESTLINIEKSSYDEEQVDIIKETLYAARALIYYEYETVAVDDLRQRYEKTMEKLDTVCEKL